MKNRATPITELLSFMVDNRGKTVPAAESGFPLIATNCIKHNSIYPTFENVRYVDEKTKDSWFRAHPEPNDIIFVNKGTPGRVCLVPDPVPFCFAQDMIGFRCDPEKIDYQYLFAVLRSDYIQKKIENYHVGLVIPHFKKGDLKHLNIPRLESRDAELAAGKLYLALSEKIELNNRINAELEAMAKTLYDYWFVQFDFPGDSPQGQGKPYKTSGGKMVYNPTLKREIPEGWEDCLLGDHVTFKRGISYKSGDIQEEGVPFLNLNSFSLSGEFKQTGTKYYNGKFKPESKLDAGELVVAITDVTRNADIIGKAFVIPDVFDEKPLISCDVACVSSKIFGEAYLEQLFNSNSYHKYIKHFASGTLVLHLDLQGVKWFKTHLPPRNLLEKFNQHCDSLFKQRDIVLKENVYLESLRDWLLPMLMNGQVMVK